MERVREGSGIGLGEIRFRSLISLEWPRSGEKMIRCIIERRRIDWASIAHIRTILLGKMSLKYTYEVIPLPTSIHISR